MPLFRRYGDRERATRGSLRRSALPICALLLLFWTAATAHAQTGDTTKRRSDTVVVPGQFEGKRFPTEDSGDGLSPIGRLRARISRDSLALRYYLDSLDNTPMAIMRRNLAMSSSDWMPTAADRKRRQQEITDSQSWGNPNDNIPRAGVSIPLKSIFRALGLIEDVTPRIRYTLYRTQHVTVTIYNLQAEKVATIVDGVQSPGEYDFYWDLLDSAAQRVTYGDYIAEVIAEKRLLLRKRIEVP